MLHLRRLIVAGLVVIGALGPTGCASSPSASAPSGSATPGLAELCADDAVATCDDIPDGIVMTVSETASETETIALAGRLHDEAAPASLDAGAVLQRASADAPVLDAEVAAPARWQVTVYPGDSAETETLLVNMLTVAAVPGTLGITVFDGWPSVTVTSLDQFDTVFDAVSVTPLFQEGGTYTLLSLDEHLRIVHVPDRTSKDAIREIVDIARDYPTAEVVLEAPIAGPQFPTLYVSRLTPDEVVRLDSRLRDPRLATADVDGHALPFVLGSTGSDGTTYTNGTFGGVASD